MKDVTNIVVWMIVSRNIQHEEDIAKRKREEELATRRNKLKDLLKSEGNQYQTELDNINLKQKKPQLFPITAKNSMVQQPPPFLPRCWTDNVSHR